MNNIKGFVSYNSLIDNTPGTNSSLGELSDLALTYSLEKATYIKAFADTSLIATLTVMKSVNAVSGLHYSLSSNQTNEIFKIVQSVKTHLAAFPNATNINIASSLSTEYPGEFSNIDFGEMITQGGSVLPQWISWISTSNNGNVIKIWLSDTAFRTQYDEYTIKIVSPIDNVGQFFTGYANVLDLVQEQNNDSLYAKISELRGDRPETLMRVLTFNYVNALNTSQTIAVKWPVLIYGAAGDNLDSIKDAIEAYLAQNSSGPWAGIFPDIFKRTEFVIMPRWDLIALPNATQSTSLYRNSMQVSELLTYAKNFLNGVFTPTHVENNAEVMAIDYKSIALVSVPGNNNLEGRTKLTELFPDYLAVNNGTDVSRMSLNTRTWVTGLTSAVYVANNPNTPTVASLNVRLQRKYNKNFVGFTHDNVSYLVAAINN